jgi:glycine oxidase
MLIRAGLQKKSDILIAGAGIIGLSLALELHNRGAQVTVLERDTALSHASSAAAGMLAVDDPHNPPALHPLSRLSNNLYSGFLDRIAALSGIAVPYQTSLTHQYLPDGSVTQLQEHSLDPRQLAAALLAAVRATNIDLREHTEVRNLAEADHRHLHIETNTGDFTPGYFIQTRGAWHAPYTRPTKGQMLRVQLPAALPLTEVHRAEHIYIVPRTTGPQAGSALLGATVEDAGFDLTTHPASLAHLRTLAAKLIPELASETLSPSLEAWAGLRPGTADHLPLIGPREPGSPHLIATGHFRNGILLAPATAVVVADLLENKTPPIDAQPFNPTRFA